MRTVGRQKDALLHDQLIGQPGGVGGGLHKAQVSHIVRHKLTQLGGGQLMQDHLYIRAALGEGGQQVRQEDGPSPGSHADVQRLLAVVLELAQVVLQLAVQVALALQVGQEQFSRRHQAQGRVGAVQKGDSQVGFQLGQVLAQVRLG